MTDTNFSNSNQNDNRQVNNNAMKVILPIIIVLFSVMVFVIVPFLGCVVMAQNAARQMEGMFARDDYLYEIDHDKETVSKKKVTVEYINSLISSQSELITAREDYSGMITIEDGSIPLITKKGFSMYYDGYVKAGVSLVKREVVVEDTIITIYLDFPQITDVYINPDSILIYDKKRALFNWNKGSDITAAISVAEEDMYRKAETDGLIKKAKIEAEEQIIGLLHELTDDYVICIEWKGSDIYDAE